MLVSTGNLYVQRAGDARRRAISPISARPSTRMTQELRTQRDDLVRAQRRHRHPPPLHRGGAGSAPRPASSASTASAACRILNRSAEKTGWPHRGRGARQAARRGVSRTRPAHADRAPETARADAGPGHHLPQRARAQPVGAGQRASRRARSRHSYIITLDDITELVSAQRTSAWADVARRIAHEIKNPPTPILLSAERLRAQIRQGRSSMIKRHLRAVHRHHRPAGRRYSAHGRRIPPASCACPRPVIVGEDVADTVRQAVFLMRVGHAELDISRRYRRRFDARAQFERRLISQALTNLIKNATEAIDAVPPEELGKGRIRRLCRARRRLTSSSTWSTTALVCRP